MLRSCRYRFGKSIFRAGLGTCISRPSYSESEYLFHPIPPSIPFSLSHARLSSLLFTPHPFPQIILDAYGKVASKRIIDDIPMLITSALIAPLHAELRRAACPTDETLRELLSETDLTATGRRRATEQLRAMEAAEAAFDAVARRRF